MHEFYSIVFNIILPVLVLIGLGVWMRLRFAIDLGSLSKLNIYLFVPAFVFYKVSTSALPWAEMGGVIVITVAQVICLGAIVWGIGRLLRVSRKTLAAIAIAVMFYNSGNYGLPLAELAYPGTDNFKNGGAVQAFVVLTQNCLTFTVGLAIAAAAGAARWSEIFTKILRLPVLYIFASALITRALTGGDVTKLPIFIAKPAEYLAAGLVPVALITLGAQLASNPRWPRWKPISLVLLLRLILRSP